MNRAWIVLALAALPLAAAPNLSGDWVLNLSKSQYGAVPPPQSMTREIQYNAPTLTMSTRQKGAQGEVTTELKYTTDGKPAVNKIPAGDAHGSAHWEGDTLVIESSLESQGTQLKSSERWTLSADGQTLTISTHLSFPNGEFEVKQVFDKARAAAAGAAHANF
jgi:hypothetical protein